MLPIYTLGQSQPPFTHADTLRGSINEQRSWWNVLHYSVAVTPDFATKSIVGKTDLLFSGKKGGAMQIDLQQPLIIDSVVYLGTHLPFTRNEQLIIVNFPKHLSTNQHLISIYYHGIPKEAKRPPWDGGWIWTKDTQGRPWMTVACQGLGASVWYPCKDHQSDEPDLGASLHITVPDSLVAVGNGHLVKKEKNGSHSTYNWEVKQPINTYNLVPYIGNYVSFNENFQGESGNLPCTYWVLDYELSKAKEQFKQVAPMLRCFEFWLGPYPFYSDGYQLVQSPHLGMEHQSAVAYGNKFMNGYLGRDLSGSGWGRLWDYIIIHESGHEWFGNNISSKDIADMWVHEGFTSYTEVLFTQCNSGLEAANAYAQGLRRNISNKQPVIGSYGVNNEGSGDMYPKGANLIHTLRAIMQNDTLFRQMLRGLNQTFFHKTVTSKEVENFLQKSAGLPSNIIFDQYLRETAVPELQWKWQENQLQVRFSNCLPQFSLPIKLPIGDNQWKTIQVSAKKWSSVSTTFSEEEVEKRFDKNYYINYRKQTK